MNTQFKMLALGTAAILAGAVSWNAVAETPTQGVPGGPAMHSTGPAGMGPGMGPGMMGGVFADPSSNLASIKQQLGITAAQDPAWDTYAKVVQETATSFKALHERTDMNAMHDGANGQAVMTQFHDQRQQALQTLRAAADQLVPTLDDAQKQKAQTVLPGLASGGHGMMGQMDMQGMMKMMSMMGMGATK